MWLGEFHTIEPSVGGGGGAQTWRDIGKITEHFTDIKRVGSSSLFSMLTDAVFDDAVNDRLFSWYTAKSTATQSAVFLRVLNVPRNATVVDADARLAIEKHLALLLLGIKTVRTRIRCVAPNLSCYVDNFLCVFDVYGTRNNVDDDFLKVPVIVTDFVDGMPLRDFLNDIAAERELPPTAVQFASLMRSAAALVQFMHSRNVVMRHFSVRNIIVQNAFSDLALPNCIFVNISVYACWSDDLCRQTSDAWLRNEPDIVNLGELAPDDPLATRSDDFSVDKLKRDDVYYLAVLFAQIANTSSFSKYVEQDTAVKLYTADAELNNLLRRMTSVDPTQRPTIGKVMRDLDDWLRLNGGRKRRSEATVSASDREEEQKKRRVVVDKYKAERLMRITTALERLIKLPPVEDVIVLTGVPRTLVMQRKWTMDDEAESRLLVEVDMPSVFGPEQHIVEIAITINNGLHGQHPFIYVEGYYNILKAYPERLDLSRMDFSPADIKGAPRSVFCRVFREFAKAGMPREIAVALHADSAERRSTHTTYAVGALEKMYAELSFRHDTGIETGNMLTTLGEIVDACDVNERTRRETLFNRKD